MSRFQTVKRFASSIAPQQVNLTAGFPSLRGQTVGPLKDQYYVDIQKRLINGREESIQKSWDRLLPVLSQEVKHIRKHGNKVVPDIDFRDLIENDDGQVQFPDHIAQEVKKRGTMIIRNVIPRNEALEIRDELSEYIKTNNAKGFPPESPTIYELYWSKAQVKGRTHPNSLKLQQALESLWHSTSSKTQPMSLRHPVAYADRLRVWKPDTEETKGGFKLGPHIDGGGVERWEDIEYSNVYKKIFSGDWENYDAFDYSHRINAQSAMHQDGGQCSALRMFQGWFSLSETGPNEGTVQINPMLGLTTAYLMLRPFFAPATALNKFDNDYDPNDGNLNVPWHYTGATSCFPNALPGCSQELNNNTHPHLHLDDTMVSMPKMYPGDYVAWHCDSIHAVEPHNEGENDASVLYVPAAPLCDQNAFYIAKARAAFLGKTPGPDFPKYGLGLGEAWYQNYGTENDILTVEGLQSMGLAPFDTSSAKNENEKLAMENANRFLFT